MFFKFKKNNLVIFGFLSLFLSLQKAQALDKKCSASTKWVLRKQASVKTFIKGKDKIRDFRLNKEELSWCGKKGLIDAFAEYKYIAGVRYGNIKKITLSTDKKTLKINLQDEKRLRTTLLLSKCEELERSCSTTAKIEELYQKIKMIRENAAKKIQSVVRVKQDKKRAEGSKKKVLREKQKIAATKIQSIAHMNQAKKKAKKKIAATKIQSIARMKQAKKKAKKKRAATKIQSVVRMVKVKKPVIKETPENIKPYVVLGHGSQNIAGRDLVVPANVTIVSFVAHGQPATHSKLSDKLYRMSKSDLIRTLNRSKKAEERNKRNLFYDFLDPRTIEQNKYHDLYIYKGGDRIHDYNITTNNPIEAGGNCNSMMKTGLYTLPVDPVAQRLFDFGETDPYGERWRTHSLDTYCYEHNPPSVPERGIYNPLHILSLRDVVGLARTGSQDFGLRDSFRLSQLLTHLVSNPNNRGKRIVLFYAPCRCL